MNHVDSWSGEQAIDLGVKCKQSHFYIPQKESDSNNHYQEHWNCTYG